MIKMKVKAFLKYGEYRKYVLKKIINKNLINKFFFTVLIFLIIIICYITISINKDSNVKVISTDNIYKINDFINSNNRSLLFISKYLPIRGNLINKLHKSEKEQVIPEVTNQTQEYQKHELIEKEEYDNLLERNKQLELENQMLKEDNVNLQNWVKTTASQGIKPKNYKIAPEITSRSGILGGEYLGQFTVTAYTPSVEECGNNRGITSSGYPIVPGVTVAVDTRYWPIGTVFYIKGLGYVMAMDCGGAIKGKNRFDFAVLDKNFARKIGVRKFDVYLIRKGEGFIGELNF